MAQKEKGIKNQLMLGAAAVAGLLGTLSTLLVPNRPVRKGWTGQVKDAASHMMDHKPDVLNKNLLIGSVAGGLVGAVTALLFAPKSGEQLMRDISRTLEFNQNSTRSASRRSSSSSAKRKPAKKTVKRAAISMARSTKSAVKKAVSRPSRSSKKAKRPTAKKPAAKKEAHKVEHHAHAAAS